MLKIFSDVEEEKEVTNDTDPCPSSNCIKPSSVPKEVSRYLEFVHNLVSELEAHEGLAKVFMMMCRR